MRIFSDQTQNFEALCKNHRWVIPEHFNIAEACCDRHHERSDEVAVYDENERGEERRCTFAEGGGWCFMGETTFHGMDVPKLYGPYETEEEAAEIMDISVRTVQREWRYIRAKLHKELAESGPNE